MLDSPGRLVRAAVNVRDRILGGPLADLRRMPRVAVRAGRGAELGRGVTYRYLPTAPTGRRGHPVLLVSPPGISAAAFDLRRGCSVVEHLVGEGRPVHLVEDTVPAVTTTPGPDELRRWVDVLLPRAVRSVSAAHRGADVHVVGWCVGGLSALLAAAAHPRLPVRSVVTVATPVDVRDVPAVARPRALAEAAGGPLLAAAHHALTGLAPPGVRAALRWGRIDEVVTTPLAVLSRLDDRDFLEHLEAVGELRAGAGGYSGRDRGSVYHRMVDAEALAAGRVEVGDRPIELASVTVPVLLLAGESDRVAPPRAVRAGTALLRGSPTVRSGAAPGGHLGVLTGRHAWRTTWARVAAFLDRQDAPAEPGRPRAPRRRGAESRLPAPRRAARVAGPRRRSGS